ncbi:hypothetical protein, partial [Cupriavidus sp. IDO]|uniref:hypothetical protein n=1 Tax=Cupriavidus sp. IDO TaxID=1539142 RepID=UPI0005798F31
MNKLYPLKTLLIAGTFAAALAAGLAQAAEPKDSTYPGGKYGYDSHVAVPNAFVDGTRSNKSAPYADDVRIVAGRDLTGVSASPDRS